jgi:hypothetical protein
MLRNGDNSTRQWHLRHILKQWEDRRPHYTTIHRQRLEMAGLVVFSVLLMLSVFSYGRRLNAQAAAQLNDMNYFVRVHDGKFVVGPSCKPFYISGKEILSNKITR